MKKIILLTIFSCAVLSAQLNIAVTGGVNLSNVNSILFGKDYYTAYKNIYKYHYFPNLGLEISFVNNKFNYLTGLSYSYRGARNYDNVSKVISQNDYDIEISGYLEIPLQVNYYYFKNKFDSGLGIILHKRVYDGVSYYDERNKLLGLDIRVSSSWNINRHLAIVPSYTLGNLDKYIANTYGNFIHHVFALNLRYTFLRFK